MSNDNENFNSGVMLQAVVLKELSCGTDIGQQENRMNNFDRAIAFVLKAEGGYVNDPKDPGGETKFGISKRAYPMLDIKTLKEEDAKLIYFNDYWLKVGCDKMEWPMSLVVFDCAVNQGIGRAKNIVLDSFNWVDVLMLRSKHYVGLHKPNYLPGWMNRILNLYWEAKK